jgi:N-acetyl-anhydromuramyl-L-alanine amidase AmpD
MLTPYNFSDYNDVSRIQYLVIHFFGDLGTALSVAQYFAGSYVGASAHYAIDELPIVYQSVDDADIAWHCGLGAANGPYFHPYCRNTNSIGIEVRPSKLTPNRQDYAEDKDWYFNEQVWINLMTFVRGLITKYNIPIENVVRHYDVTHKYCPRPFMGDDINTCYGITGNKMWARFKEELQNGREEIENMDFANLTDQEVDQLVNRINARLATLPVSDYAKDSSVKGISSGLFSDGNKDGLVDNPQAFLKRQELATVLNKAGLLDKKY